MQLKDKVAVITGAGRGLGKDIALYFAEEGAKVAILSRTEADLKAVSDKIAEKKGKCMIFAGDISNPDDVARFFAQTRKVFGRVDILVNNAAIIGPPRFMEDAAPDAWMKTININLNGMYYCIRQVLPEMIERKSGKILCVTSGLGSRPFPNFCAYAVSKGGVNQLTRSLSEELKPFNIQVNAIDPGVMDTSMQDEIRSLGEEKLRTDIYSHFITLKKGGLLTPPAEIAEIAMFLSTPASDHITGEIVAMSDLERLRQQCSNSR